MEAQYQNEVRLAIQNLYIAYVDVLAARETVRYLQTSIKGLDEVLRAYEGLYTGKTPRVPTSTRRGRIVKSRSSGLLDAEEAVRQRKVVLGELLSLPPTRPSDSSCGARSATSRRRCLPSPSWSSSPLTVGLTWRPIAWGSRRRKPMSGFSGPTASRTLICSIQPYTYQNNAPYGKQSGTSWALGITVPLPVYNRNQGNIERAKINVYQSEVQLAYQEQRVETEVRQAIKEYQVSGQIAERIRDQVLPDLEQAYRDRLRLFQEGEITKFVFLDPSADTTTWPRPISMRRCVIAAAC